VLFTQPAELLPTSAGVTVQEAPRCLGVRPQTVYLWAERRHRTLLARSCPPTMRSRWILAQLWFNEFYLAQFSYS
jgi:hypothetical protein